MKAEENFGLSTGGATCKPAWAMPPPPPQTYHLRSGRVAKSMMGSTEDWAFGSEPWTAPALEDLLPELSREEQLRLQSHLREHERILKWRKKNSFPLASLRSEDERDAVIIPHVRYALHRYNAKHPGEEFDAVKPLMGSSVRFRGQVWFHINFWARCRKSKKVKRFFAEVRYKPSGSSSVRPGLPFPVPGAEKPPRSGSDCLDLSFPDPGAEKQPSSSSISSDLSTPVPEAEKQCSSSSACLDVPFPLPIPIVEACTIIEEPLSRYWRSCAFCRGHLDILHPMGRKFICGNDKDRVVQRLLPCVGLQGICRSLAVRARPLPTVKWKKTDAQ